MKTSQNGKALVKKFEGLHDGDKKTAILEPEMCPAGRWTLGWGSTFDLKGNTVTKSTPGITLAEAETLLDMQLRKAESAVLSLVKVPLTQNQFDALVCFVYNVGEGAFRGSTLLRKLNERCYECAAQQFLVWNKATVKGVLTVLPGLTLRRSDERKLFCTP
jgi:lysozyme